MSLFRNCEKCDEMLWREVAQVIQRHVIGKGNFSVEWVRNSYPEGYLYTRGAVPKAET